MKRVVISCVLLAMLGVACSQGASDGPTATPMGSEGRCGDGVCDGPEDATRCPQDCDADALSVSREEATYQVINPASGARLHVRVLYPQAWDGEVLPALVLVPGGTGDSSDFLDQLDRTQAIADGGFVLVLFDPDGRGLSEGSEDQNGYVHQDGLAAVIRFAATLPEVDEEQIGLVSWSYGVTMAAGALARHDDLPVRFYIDWEGPANRDDTGGCGEDAVGHLQGHPCDDEDFWREREASTLIMQIWVPYLRLQSERDHAQPDNDHALLMIANATAEQYGGHGHAPWTRLNDLTPNTVYDVANPPPMIPEGDDRDVGALLVINAHELLALAW